MAEVGASLVGRRFEGADDVALGPDALIPAPMRGPRSMGRLLVAAGARRTRDIVAATDLVLVG